MNNDVCNDGYSTCKYVKDKDEYQCFEEETKGKF